MVSRIRMAFKLLCLIAIVYLGYFLFIELFYPWRHYESISAYRFKLYGDFKMSGDRIAFDEVDPTALIGSAHSRSVDMPRHSSQLFTGILSNQSSDYFEITQFSSLPEHISGAGFSPPLFERTLSWFTIRTHGCVYLHQHKLSSKKALLARVLVCYSSSYDGPDIAAFDRCVQLSGEIFESEPELFYRRRYEPHYRTVQIPLTRTQRLRIFGGQTDWSSSDCFTIPYEPFTYQEYHSTNYFWTSPYEEFKSDSQLFFTFNGREQSRITMSLLALVGGGFVVCPVLDIGYCFGSQAVDMVWLS